MTPKTNTAAITLIARFAGLIDQISIVHLLDGDAKAVGVPNDRSWLQADIQSPEIEVRLYEALAVKVVLVSVA